MFLSLPAVGSVVRLRRQAGYEPKFRMPCYPWPVVIFLLVMGGALALVAEQRRHDALVGLASIAGGLPLYYLYATWGKGKKQRQPSSNHLLKKA